MEQPTILEQPPVEQLSFMDKAAGVFYEPSKVFESLKKSGPQFADWFVPVLVLAIITSIATYVRMTSPDLASQFQQMQEQRIDKMVTNGKMTADQAQQAKERMSSASGIAATVGTISTFIGVFIFFFIISAIALLIGKAALKAPAMSYNHAMVISGIPSWIGIVGAIIGIVISVTFSRFDGGLHLGLLRQMNSDDKVYQLMVNVNLFTIWSLLASSIGLAVISGKKTGTALMWVFGIWIVLVLIGVFVLGGLFG